MSAAARERVDVGTSTRETILAVARRDVQAHGYSGLNFRDIAQTVGIKAASIYHYFPSKADLGAAVARRYWEDSAAALQAISDAESDPVRRLHEYPGTFRTALENDNRLCLGSFMAAEYDDLPEQVRLEVQAFGDVNIEWLGNTLVAAKAVTPSGSDAQARAIFAAIAGAQLLARSRSDISLFDRLIDSYRAASLLP